jgi:hypothetical protein
MPEERTTLTQHMLGMEPYVLITFDVVNGDPVAKIEAGGGCDDMRSALLFALAGMDPLNAEEVAMLTGGGE